MTRYKYLHSYTNYNRQTIDDKRIPPWTGQVWRSERDPTSKAPNLSKHGLEARSQEHLGLHARPSGPEERGHWVDCHTLKQSSPMVIYQRRPFSMMLIG